MNSAATTVSTAPQTCPSESIRHLPAPAREAFARFQSHQDLTALDTILLAILEDFMPKPVAKPLAGLPGNTRLIYDLNFDSIALTEVVFFAEDLFDITITNEEITQVDTLDTLRSFIRAKVNARSTS